MDFYEFVRGPLATISFVIFIIGTCSRLVSFYLTGTNPRDESTIGVAVGEVAYFESHRGRGGAAYGSSVRSLTRRQGVLPRRRFLR